MLLNIITNYYNRKLKERENENIREIVRLNI